MKEWLGRLKPVRPSNWEIWPTLRGLWPWFAALGVILIVAIPWGLRAEERNLEESSRAALTEAGIAVEDISFTGRQATIVADLNRTQQATAIYALVDVGGVAGVTWVEGSGLPIAAPIATAPPTTSTTTAAPEPGAQLTAYIQDGRLTLRGTVTDAATVRDVTDAAATLWGSDVVNQLFVDADAPSQVWQPGAGDALVALTMLIDAELTLDHTGAALTGSAISEDDAADALASLESALGPDVAIESKVTVTPLTLPSFEIIAPGDGTITLRGTVASKAVRRAITDAARATGDDVELSNEITVSETTADIYLARRAPDMIAALGVADEWMLRYDGESLGGSLVGGKAFVGNRVRPTAALAEVVNLLTAYLEADPNLVMNLEVQATPRQGNNDEASIAADRADALTTFLVRAGVDPWRLSADVGTGDGELLRFWLVPADQ